MWLPLTALLLCSPFFPGELLPSDLALAEAVLSAPVDSPIVLTPGREDQCREAVKQLAARWEVRDECDIEYGQDYVDGCGEGSCPTSFEVLVDRFRERRAELAGVPLASWAGFLPSHAVAERYAVFNRDVRRVLLKRLPFEQDRDVELRAAIRHLDDVHAVWWAVADATNPAATPVARRYAIKHLLALEAEGFRLDDLPPPVPDEYFEELR